jgi:hypothetical protein
MLYVELNIAHLGLAAQTGGIHQNEFVAECIVAHEIESRVVPAISVTMLRSSPAAEFTSWTCHVGSAHHGNARNFRLGLFHAGLFEVAHRQQLARAVADWRC